MRRCYDSQVTRLLCTVPPISTHHTRVSSNDLPRSMPMQGPLAPPPLTQNTAFLTYDASISLASTTAADGVGARWWFLWKILWRGRFNSDGRRHWEEASVVTDRRMSDRAASSRWLWRRGGLGWFMLFVWASRWEKKSICYSVQSCESSCPIIVSIKIYLQLKLNLGILNLHI